jgi:hypothetical protein
MPSGYEFQHVSQVFRMHISRRNFPVRHEASMTALLAGVKQKLLRQISIGNHEKNVKILHFLIWLFTVSSWQA